MINIKNKNSNNIDYIYIPFFKYINNQTDNIVHIMNLDITKPLIISYDNDPKNIDTKGATDNYIRGLEYYTYNYIIVGIGKKWNGWYGRLVEYIKILQTLPKEQLVVITDARDVLINTSESEFINNYNELLQKYNDIKREKIVFSSEYGCCVGPMRQYDPGTIFSKKKKIKQAPFMDENNNINGMYPWGNNKLRDEPFLKFYNFFIEKFLETRIKYNLNLPDDYKLICLNFGMCLGKVESILEMFKFFNIQKYEDDQHLASEYFYIFPERIILDYEQKIFTNTGYKHNIRKCTGKTEKNIHFKLDFNEDIESNEINNKTNQTTIRDDIEKGQMYYFDDELKKYIYVYNDLKTSPTFFQSPGRDWNCYNDIIYKLPYCNKYICSYYKDKNNTKLLNIKDIIYTEYNKKEGDINLVNEIIENILNPIDVAIRLKMINMIYKYIIQTDIKIILIGSSLLGYQKYNNLNNNILCFMPWEKKLMLGMYYENENNEILNNIFENIINENYELEIYYKNKGVNISKYNTKKINKENKKIIKNILTNYDIRIITIYYPKDKYDKILKEYNNSNENNIIPNITIYIFKYNNITNEYEFNSNIYINEFIDSLFKDNYIKISKKNIFPIKKINYNTISLYIPNNIDKYIKQYYKYNNNILQYIDNELKIKYNNTNIIKLIIIYNEYILLYYNELDKNI
jgi:hypothetical protein